MAGLAGGFIIENLTQIFLFSRKLFFYWNFMVTCDQQEKGVSSPKVLLGFFLTKTKFILKVCWMQIDLIQLQQNISIFHTILTIYANCINKLTNVCIFLRFFSFSNFFIFFFFFFFVNSVKLFWFTLLCLQIILTLLLLTIKFYTRLDLS